MRTDREEEEQKIQEEKAEQNIWEEKESFRKNEKNECLVIGIVEIGIINWE